ncbi:PilW family protein [Pseudomonadota bacterium]
MKIRRMNLKQTGAGLMEVLIAMSISLVVTASMIALMANSLGSTTRIIQMTKLSDDMRVALQMMSRDLRRASYNANSMYCYANTDCADDGIVTVAGDITLADIDSDSVNDCLTFLTDRDYDGDSTEDSAGGFRRVTTGDGVGIIEMWTGDAAADCMDDAGAAGWVQITDPSQMNISGFSIDDSLSYVQDILDDGTNKVSMRIRKVRMLLEGELVLDSSITREMQDIISVRNDLLL